MSFWIYFSNFTNSNVEAVFVLWLLIKKSFTCSGVFYAFYYMPLHAEMIKLLVVSAQRFLVSHLLSIFEGYLFFCMRVWSCSILRFLCLSCFICLMFSSNRFFVYSAWLSLAMLGLFFELVSLCAVFFCVLCYWICYIDCVCDSGGVLLPLMGKFKFGVLHLSVYYFLRHVELFSPLY